MDSDEGNFRPWARLRPYTPTEVFVRILGALGFCVLLGSVFWGTPGPAVIPALLGCMMFVGITVLARKPQLWNLPEGASTAQEIAAQYENARSAITWMNTATVWCFVGLACLPRTSLSEAPPGLRTALVTTAVATVVACLIEGVTSLIRVHRPLVLVENQGRRLGPFLVLSIYLHVLPLLLLQSSCGKPGGGSAGREEHYLASQGEVPLYVTLLDSTPPHLAPTTSQQLFSPKIDQSESTSSSDAAQPKAAHAEVQSEAVGSEPPLDFNHPSEDYSDPVLLLDGKEDWPVFGAPKAFASGSSQSVDMPKGMLQGQLCFIPKGTRSLDAAESCHPVGTLYTRSLYVPRTDFLKGFPGISARYEWFAIDYRGTFTVRTAGTYRFRLYSDDGGRLYIDGKRFINNDGLHPASNAFANIYLSSTEHSIRVHYFQGPQMEVALILSVIPPGGSERVWTAEL